MIKEILITTLFSFIATCLILLGFVFMYNKGHNKGFQDGRDSLSAIIKREVCNEQRIKSLR